MRPVLVALTLALPLLPSSASAQSEEEPAPARVLYQKETHLDFDAQRLVGELADDSATWVEEPRRPDFAPLIRLRTNFNPELSASVNEVR